MAPTLEGSAPAIICSWTIGRLGIANVRGLVDAVRTAQGRDWTISILEIGLARHQNQVQASSQIDSNYWLDFNTGALPDQRFDLRPAPLPINILRTAQRRFQSHL
jgi:hypothetical protein